MKDTTYAFYHDYNTRSDSKIKKLIMQHGMLGYGVYWAIVEDLYNNNNKLDITINTFAFDLRVEEEIIQSVLKDFNLFQIKKNILSSKAVGERIVERRMKSEKAKSSAITRWSKDANALRPQYERNANAMQSQCERNAIKEKKRKENSDEDFSFSLDPKIAKQIKKLTPLEYMDWIDANKAIFKPAESITLPSGRIVSKPRYDVPNPFKWGYSLLTGFPDINVLSDEQRQANINTMVKNGTVQ